MLSRRLRLPALVTALLVALVVLAPAAHANPGNDSWTRQMGSDADDYVRGVAVAPDGSVYVGFQVEGVVDAAILRKYDSAGLVLWTFQFGPANATFINDVAVGPDGSVYAVGSTSGAFPTFSNLGSEDMFVIKFNPAGDEIWTRQFGTGELDALRTVAVAPDGRVVVGGWTHGAIAAANPSGYDAYVRVLTPAGDLVCHDQFGPGTGDAVVEAIAVGPSGSIAAAGWTSGAIVGQTHQGSVDAFVMQYASPGPGGCNASWIRQFGSNQYDAVDGVAVAADGSVYAGGVVYAALPDGGAYLGAGDGFLRKYNAGGTPIWTRQFGTTSADWVRDVAVDLNGRVFVAGWTEGALAGSVGFADGFLRKYTPAGTAVWTRQFGTAASDWAGAVAVASDGSVYVGGETAGSFGGPTFGFRDVFIRKYAGSVIRYAGANRFATAVNVSRHDFSEGVEVAFVAAGSNFPDALAGAAAAGKFGGSLLLVNTNSIPAETAAELARLNPDVVVILGGPAAVSAAVAEDLGAYGTVVRLSGDNRYETAVEISKWAFANPIPVQEVVIATGANFPDALGGGPVATQVGGPVLLVQPNALPAAVKAEIQRLAPARITVLGGVNAVSDAVVAELNTIAPTTRISGADRYLTAVAASAYAFPGSTRVYIAVGTNFPDALAGAGAAGFYDAPVLLTPSNTVPSAVTAELQRLGAQNVIILGGTAVVSVSAENQLRVFLGF